jgi:hypothetical protein
MSSDPAASASPPATSSVRLRRTAEAASRAAPARLVHRAAVMKRPARPCVNGSATMPRRRRSVCSTACSATTPSTPIARAGAASAVGLVAAASPPAAASALAPKMYGISRCASCQTGTAVSAISTPV